MEPLSRNWVTVHGALMISGFLGTLICLERAVALASRYRWTMVVPAINGAGAVFLLVARDVALLHAFLFGFVFSMIFGHMPLILPALTGLRVNYSPVFYGHLALLHVTLGYRMIGNLSGDFTAQQWGGLLNVAAVLLFIAVTVVTVFRSNLMTAKPQTLVVTEVISSK